MKQDNALVRECLAGNKKAWESLIERYSQLIYGIARRRGLTEEDAADVFQTVCVKLLSNLERLKDDQHLIGWMVTTAKNECSYILRQTSRQPLSYLQEIDDSKLARMTRLEDLTEEQILQLEEEHLVRVSVEQLGQRCQELIGLLYLESPPCSYADVAIRLDIPLGSIGPTRARCLKTLKGKLIQAGF